MLHARALHISLRTSNFANLQQTGHKYFNSGTTLRQHGPTFNTRNYGSKKTSGVDIVYGSLDYPFIVVNKQPGLGIQFRADRNADSLEKRLNALGKKSCFFVNRLDAVTQGLMVVAFSAEAASLLGKSMDNQEWFKKYRVLSPIPNWLHKFYTDFSLTFPNYNIQQPPKSELPHAKKGNLRQDKEKPQKAKNNATNINPIKHESKEKSSEKTLNFLKQYIPNKSPFISGELVNNKMQLCKNGILISYFTRFSPTLRPSDPTLNKSKSDPSSPTFLPPARTKKEKPIPLPSTLLNAKKGKPIPSLSPSPSPSPSSLLLSPQFDVPSLWDNVTFSKGVIEDSLKPILKKNPRHHSVPRKFDDLTKLAITEFELVAADFEHKYLIYEVILHTGRTHQIRSHFSESGFTIYGDVLYSQTSILENSSEEDDEKSGGIGLQAFYLQFPDPYKRKNITVELEIPEEFLKIMT